MVLQMEQSLFLGWRKMEMPLESLSPPFYKPERTLLNFGGGIMGMGKYTVVIEKGEDGYLIGEVLELPGCHTQAKTLEQLDERLKEAIALYLEETAPAKRKTPFVGIRSLEV